MEPPFTAELVEWAYRNGIFPMAMDDGAIAWFRPDPRAIIPLNAFHVSRSLRRTMARGTFAVTVDRDFEGVMRACAEREEGSWITEEFVGIYTHLHRERKAHSVEAWRDGRLVGGTYGVALGGAFMAESMFHRETDAGKVALASLVERLADRRFALLDVQYMTPHLKTLGAIEVSGRAYLRRLREALGLARFFA